MELGKTPKEIRQAIRQGRYTGGTAGLAAGYVQANLVILPRAQAYDFLVFCQRNPRPCPLIEVTDPGNPEPTGVAAGADLRTDVPKYRIYRDGRLDAEVTDITSEWRDDFVAFLLGCSFTFESALLQSGVPVRHIEEQRIVPMFRTNLACRPAGIFRGPMVVSMRPIPAPLVPRAVTVTARYPMAHGAPVHVGDSGAHRHRRRDEARLGRPADAPGRRGARLLGLRRDAAGGGPRGEAAAGHHACPGAHVRHGPARPRAVGALADRSLRPSLRRWLYTPRLVCSRRETARSRSSSTTRSPARRTRAR